MSFSTEFAPVIANIPSVGEIQMGDARLAVAAAAIGVAAVYRQFRQNNVLNQQAEAEYPTPDMNQAVQTAVKREKRRSTIMTGLAGVALSAAALNAANISTDQTELKIDSAAVIVDASYNSYVEDISEDDGTAKRIEAVVNGINDLDTEGIEISYWAAGTESQLMGTTNGKDGQSGVVDEFFSYTSENLSSRTGSDLTGAVNDALSSNAKRVIIFSNQIDEETQFALKGQTEPGENRVSVVQIGETEAQVEMLGEDRQVVIDSASAEAAVGPEDVYGDITSVEDLQDVFNDIKQEQFVSEEQHKLGIFKTIRDVAGAALAGSFLLNGLLRKRQPKGVK